MICVVHSLCLKEQYENINGNIYGTYFKFSIASKLKYIIPSRGNFSYAGSGPEVVCMQDWDTHPDFI